MCVNWTTFAKIDWATLRAPSDWPLWATAALELSMAALLGLAIGWAVTGVARRIVKRTPFGVEDALLFSLRRPVRVMLPLLLVMLVRDRQRAALLPTGVTAAALGLLDRLLQLGTIAVLSWLVAAAVAAVVYWIKRAHPVNVQDNADARRIQTQATVIGRTVQVILVLIGLSAALMTFPLVQRFGTSLLASAGVAGLVIGLAARPVLENLFAGIQIGLTQPMRLDDVVIVDGEWGRVEEITLTYVVVKIWDERRLILPFSKFLTDSFQNWTRSSAQIMGTVFVWVDYSASIPRVREEAKRIVESSALWDRRVFAVQVTDTTDRAVQVRVLISSADASTAFDLRVLVREQLIAFIQKELPDALPRTRLGEAPPNADQAMPRPGGAQDPRMAKQPEARPSVDPIESE